MALKDFISKDGDEALFSALADSRDYRQLRRLFVQQEQRLIASRALNLGLAVFIVVMILGRIIFL